MIKYSKFYIFILTGFLFNIILGEQVLPAISNPPKHIYDYAGVLNQSQLATIENLLMRYEDSTSTQIAVLIEKSSKDYDVFDRAMFVARGWKIGQEGKNNGVLLYIASDDHKYHTVVANKAQARLNDGLVGEIQRNSLVPFLKNGDYFNGILNTVSEYQNVLSGEFKGTSFKRKKSKFPKFVIPLIIVFLILLFSKRGNGGGGFNRGGFYTPPIWLGGMGGLGGNSGGGGGGSDWGGFGGGGGFDGGGAGGSW